MAVVKRKHSILTINEKTQTSKRLDNGESLQEIAGELNVELTAMKDRRKNRKKIENHAHQLENNHVSIRSILEQTEGGGCDIYKAMKSLRIKHAICTIAESWDELPQSTLGIMPSCTAAS